MSWEGVQNLIEQAKAGDQAAWKALHDRFQPYVLLQAQKRLGPGWPERSVSDLSQDTWLRVSQSITSFRGADDDKRMAASFRAFLRKTMQRTFLNTFRAGQTQRRKPPPGSFSINSHEPRASGESQTQFEPVSREATPSANIRNAEDGSRIVNALNMLDDPADRDLLLLYFFENRSLNEIAAQRNIHPDTLRYRFHAILKRLGHDLKDLR